MAEPFITVRHYFFGISVDISRHEVFLPAGIFSFGTLFVTTRGQQLMHSTRAMVTALMICIPLNASRGQERPEAPSTEKRDVDSAKRPEDAATAIGLLKGAIESIRTVQCKTVCSQMLPVKTGGKLFRDGKTILEEFTWEWNAQTSQMAVKGSHVLAHPNGVEYGYSEFWGASDGDKLRTFCEPTMKGQLVPIGTQLSMHFSVSALLGMDVGSGDPKVGICNVLEGGTLEHDAEDPEAILLKSPLPTGERINSYQVRVWLDPSKGFLAKKFEMMLPNIGVTHYRTEIMEFFQTPDGTWLPIKGKWSSMGYRTGDSTGLH